MKHTAKGNSTIYQFLEESGVLQGKTDAEIKAARQQYWKNYRVQWQKEKRKEQSEFTVSFTKPEMRILKTVVDKHQTSFTNFIKLAVLAYIQRKFVVLYPSAINEIRELLIKNYSAVQSLEDQMPCRSLEGTLAKQIEALESAILKTLYNPLSLEQAIKDEIQNNPDTRQSLIELIQS